LRPQRAGAGSTGSAARPSRRHAEGGQGLAESELHHVPRVYPAGLLSGRIAAGSEVRKAAQRGSGHQLDHRVRHAGGAVQERVMPRSARRGHRR
jgi:hypothetical protein